jgi:hypothetical protein
LSLINHFMSWYHGFFFLCESAHKH